MNIENTSKITKVDSIRVGLAPPERIKKWAERTLPNGKIVGQVLSSQTVNYKTLKPEKDGLFCERIFGPVKDFECACGRKKNKTQQQFCPDCDVEFTSARVRRYRLGYIQLVSPVTHVWYLKGTPSYISIILEMRRKKVEAITYCTETTNISGINFADLYSGITPSRFSNAKSNQTLPGIAVLNLENLQEQRFEQTKWNSDFIQSKDTHKTQEIEQDSNSESKQRNYNVFTREPLIPGYDDLLSSFSKEELHSSKGKTLGERFNISLEKKKEGRSLGPSFEETSLTKTPVEKSSQNKQVNNYYTIFQTASWEVQDDLNKFSYYMSASFEAEDTPIPIYFDRIKDQFLLLNNIYINPTHFDIPLTGAEALRSFLKNLDLQLLNRQIRVELFELNEEIHEFENQNFLFLIEQRRLKFLLSLRAKKLRRLKLVRHFRRTKAQPEWMILSILPVLPPDLRPIIQLDGDQVAVSDLNKLYQKVLFRNNRMKRHKKSNCSNKSDEIKYAQRLLQEAVDALIENGKGGADPICASNDRPLKSLSDMLKGKKGRFRQNLLGKRVDYSGRSVIVVGPKLKIHECGLPKEMAIELFQPFLIRRLMTTQIVRTIVSAKRLIQRQDPVIWEILQQVLKNHPILLNRAPTLHRLGIQAFQPKLVDGRAILLHPLVCPAFNADFDGDQMAVHVPLSFQARAEAWKLMWSRNNLLSPATGQPILIPSQDMVLGCYYLTTTNSKALKGIGKYFIDLSDSLKAFNQKKIALHAPIWVRWSGQFETGNLIEKPLEIRIDCFGNISNLYHKYQRTSDKNLTQKSQFIRTTAGRILLNQILLNN
uniref:DNA-directed RNA polymerase subunit beta' n=1 Tax=Pseudochlorella signiensis TaxID=173497 RepID=A0A097KKY8_9CHLO|nr:beta' subunit of RNA polymerase [Pseudochlorella signiensis]AIT93854.1 beta' subunit of RNA polymerase [Pseudochlorella signiensis]